MLNKIKSLLGLGPAINFKELMGRGAIIIDVRTKGEFASGHIEKSINIPLQNLSQNLSKIDKNSPIITCCASGMRSANAKNVLIGKGFKEVVNGGSWSSLNNKLNH
jgi:rhodanese-related sulfurtransferase